MRYNIRLVPVTKKNSQRIVINSRTKRPMVIPSETYKIYEKACGYYLEHAHDPIDYPVNVKCVYYMPTRRRVDLVNLQEATLDVLVRWQVLADDNSKIVVSMDGSRVLYDKEDPRTEICITKEDNE